MDGRGSGVYDDNHSVLKRLSTRKLAIPSGSIFDGVLKPTERTEGLLTSEKLFTLGNRWAMGLDFKSVAAARITEVTGITRSTQDGTDNSVGSATEEAQFTWEPNNNKSYGDLFACLPTAKVHTGMAMLRLYDDGWRTEKVALKIF